MSPYRLQDELVPGLAIALPEGESIDGRIAVYPGSAEVAREEYGPEAFLPRDLPRALTSGQRECLERSGGPATFATEVVGIAPVPASISRGFDLMRRSIARHNRTSVVRNLLHHPEVQRSCQRLLEWCRAAGSGDESRILGHACRLPGLPTATVDETTGKRLGLHVDRWSEASVSARRCGLPSRLCVNLGPEDRYLLFVNLPLRRIAALATVPMDEDPRRFATDFLRANPGYPVLRLRIRPGEAYIAPTEILIHDSTTLGKCFLDASVTVVGDFDRDVLENLQRGEGVPVRSRSVSAAAL